MRVLQLAPVLQGGAGRMIAEMAKELVTFEIECAVISSGKLADLKDWPDLVLELKQAGISYTEINLFDRSQDTFWQSVEALAKYLKREQFDLLHVHSGVPALIAHFALDWLEIRLPVLATFHGWGLDRPQWMNIADIYAFRRCDKVTVLSNYNRSLMQDMGVEKDKLVVIPYGIKPSFFHRKVNRSGLERLCNSSNEQVPILVNLAVVEPRKNQQVLIEALALLSRKRRVKLALIGEIKDREYYQKLIKTSRALAVEADVSFTGHRKDGIELMGAADVLVFSSISEGFGISILEAMALAVPVVSVTEEGPGDFVIDGETALGIDAGNPQEIADAVSRLLDDESLRNRLTTTAKERVKSSFTWPDTVAAMAELYNDLAKQNPQ